MRANFQCHPVAVSIKSLFFKAFLRLCVSLNATQSHPVPNGKCPRFVLPARRDAERDDTMGTKHQRVKIDRDFMRALRPTGDYQTYQCDELRGFGVKVTPAGSASYTYRWAKPDGTQGRKTIGYYPAMNPGDARNAAKREREIIDHKGDTLTVAAARKVKRTEIVKAVRGVPTRARAGSAGTRGRVNVVLAPLDYMGTCRRSAAPSGHARTVLRAAT